MKRLYVWVRGADGTARLVGELGTTEPLTGGRFESEFEYAAEWSTDPGAFALDPVSLPLQPLGRRFRAQQFYPPLSVFDDSLPDDWGRRLLARPPAVSSTPSATPRERNTTLSTKANAIFTISVSSAM